MIDEPYVLTIDKMAKIMSLPKSKQTKWLKLIGEMEHQRCSNDVMYWLDESRHPGIPYVYTKDPHPMYQCMICKDAATYHFNKRSMHLEMRHNLHVDNDKEVRGHFTELPTTRPFTIMPYMEPIIDAWMMQPLMALEKSRDMMATWLVVALYTWDTLFNKGRENIFQSENSSKTLELVERAYFIYKKQPKFLRDVHKASFSAGQNKSGVLKVDSLESEIFGLPQGSDQIRMYHPTGMFSDEAAFQDGAGDSFAAVKPSIQNGGRYTAVSSANPSFFMFLCRDSLDEL